MAGDWMASLLVSLGRMRAGSAAHTRAQDSNRDARHSPDVDPGPGPDGPARLESAPDSNPDETGLADRDRSGECTVEGDAPCQCGRRRELPPHRDLRGPDGPNGVLRAGGFALHGQAHCSDSDTNADGNAHTDGSDNARQAIRVR